MTPEERAPYIAQKATSNAQYEAEIQAFNARVPLSPSIGSTPGHSDSGLSEDEDEDEEEMYDENSWRRVVQRWNRYRRDHPRACGGAIVPVPEKPFRFLDLKPNIRAKIYRLVLPRDSTVIQMEPDGSAGLEENNESAPVDVRIFTVNKQMYEEATEVFFVENDVLISPVDVGNAGLPLSMFRPDDQGSYGTLISKLKRLHIVIPMSKTLQTRRLEWILKRVCKVLAEHCHLTKVRITPAAQSSWYVPELDTAMDGLLETLKVIRGVKTVVFTDQAALLRRSGGWTEQRIIGTQAQKERIQNIMGSPG